jgi:hypothetical protein
MLDRPENGAEIFGFVTSRVFIEEHSDYQLLQLYS